MMKFDPADLVNFKKEINKFPDDLKEIEIKEIFIGNGILKELNGLMEGKKVLLVMDDTQITASGEDVKKKVYDFLKDSNEVEKIVLKHSNNPGGILHADFENVEKVKSRLTNDTVVVSVGSGTITDIAKHACFLFSKNPLTFIVVQTANTVTAFTSNIAVLYKDGVKRTYPSRYPDYVISDLDILMDAPFELTQAGFGDLLARYVSYVDWYIGYKLNNLEKYSEVPKLLLDDLLEYLLQHSEEIKNKNPEVFMALTKALLNAGISMSIVGMSTPISGYEHVISHVLDMISTNQERESALHGIQVGLATVISAYVYDELLQNETIKVDFPNWNELEKSIRMDFSKFGFNNSNIDEMLKDYKIKFDKWLSSKNEIEEFLQNWNEEKVNMQKLLKSGGELKNSLKKIGLSLKLNDFNPPMSIDDLKFAFLHAQFIRRRFTIGDLLYFAGKLDAQLFERVAKRLGIE